MINNLEADCNTVGFTILGVVDSINPQTNATGQVCLIGHYGDDFWTFFEKSQKYKDKLPNRIDRYSQRILAQIKPKNARLIMPNDQPYAPFQQWAIATGLMHQSPLGLLIHHEYGLWCAFRGAFILPSDTIPNIKPKKTTSPCLSCADKPCLHSCPVQAFTEAGLNANKCATHLDDPENICIDHQCLARLACPIATEYQYKTDAGQFFLKSFADSVLLPNHKI